MSAGFYDPLAGDDPDEAGAACAVEDGAGDNPAKVAALRPDPADGRRAGKAARKPMIEFLRPSEIAEYETPPNHFLVGDSLIQRGAMTIFAGPGGVGKSRAVFSLAVAAARGEATWMGFPIHFGFKTLVVQSENGLPRLSKDFKNLGDAAGLDNRMLVSSPPEMISMKNQYFREDLVNAARGFGPDLIVFDPLNSMVSDSQERDIIELLTYLRQIVGEVGTNPALLVVHHLRKPREGDKHRGRSMANLLAGSYVITSSARSVLTLQAASDDEADPHVVLTCAKLNDGQMSPRSAWRRTDGGFFAHADDFDWTAFDGQSGPMAKIREEHILRLFDYGARTMTQSAGAKALQEMTDSGRSAAYAALDHVKGRFASLLEPDLVCGVLHLSEEGKRRAEADDE
jgi:hypothetical protein